jgi:hypothetical protein
MHMRRPLTMIIVMALLGAANLHAQQSSIIAFLAESERKYGSDADLVNGEKYFYPYAQSLGDPFFFPESQSAVITIHEKVFEDQLLRYDIFNQKLILDYQNIYGANSSVVLRNEWVESFAFEGHSFRKMLGPDGKTSFFQVLTDGPIECLYLWSKKYQLNLTSGVQSYYFTEPVRESFLRIEGKYYSYKSNGNFLKAFDSELQKPIKLFLRQAKIKVKTASDFQMRHLVEYCNSLSHEN